MLEAILRFSYYIFLLLNLRHQAVSAKEVARLAAEAWSRWSGPYVHADLMGYNNSQSLYHSNMNSEQRPSIDDQILRLRQILDSSPTLIHTARPDGYLDFFNRTWCEYVGKPVEELYGWKWTSCVHPDDIGVLIEKWRESIATGNPLEAQARVRRADGEFRWMLHQKIVQRDADGAIIQWHGSSIDIEGSKKVEQSLRKNAEELEINKFFLSEAQRLGQMGSWSFDPALGFDHWSAELFQIHGLEPTREAPTSETYLALVHPEDREFMALLMKQMLAEASGFDVTKRIIRPNGQLRYVRCVCSAASETGNLKRIGVGVDVTEHELLTQELRRREAYWAEAQKLSHTGSLGRRPGRGDIVWSDETYRIFECDPAEKVTVEMIMGRVHPEDRDLVLEMVERTSSGGAIDCEYRLLFPDDRVKYVRVLARPLETASDGLEIAGAVVDITEAKRAEEKLRLSERELRTLVEAIPSYVGTALPDGSVDFISQSWLDYTGYSTEQGAGWGWASVIHPEDVDRVMASWQTGLTAGAPVEHELRCRRADGSYHWFLYRSLPLRNAGGNVAKWYGTLTNIDALKQIEYALQMREHELLGIIETIPSMLWSISPTGEITHLSQRIVEYCGAPLEEILNRGWEKSIHPDDREETLKAFAQAMSSGESYSAIHRVRRADGEYRWHHSMGEPLRDPQGKIIQWYGLNVDIDERKRAEDHLRDTRNKLSTASRIATVAELSASIAHELNQPLMAVLGNAQAAKRWLASNPPNLAETNASIERILRDIRSADQTMQHIRALFKSEPYEKSDESVLDIIRESLRFVHEDPNKRTVRIDSSIEGSLPPICVDRIQIQQVFINLISNAIEATDGSKNRAGILLRAFVTQEYEVIVQVIDNGTGLEDTEKIFDAFMTTKEKGMGIGLPISRSIVEAHGGRLWAENNPGGGATFNVALPVSSKREIH
jgi:PAS domain S-box-containing protein